MSRISSQAIQNKGKVKTKTSEGIHKKAEYTETLANVDEM